jgi:phospholipase C
MGHVNRSDGGKHGSCRTQIRVRRPLPGGRGRPARTMSAGIAAALAVALLAAQLTLPTAAQADTVVPNTPIQHLVVIYQENRSFDHYFGTYPNALNPRGEPAFQPAPGTPTPDGLTQALLTNNPNKDATGKQVNPFRLDRSQAMTCDQSHNYTNEQLAMDGGLMDGFVTNTGNQTNKCAVNNVKGAQTMGYFDGNTVTALWNYSQHYSLNDHSFGTGYGPSTPGALNLVSGQTNGASPSDGKRVLNGTVLGDPDPFFDDCGSKTNAIQMTGRNIGNLLNTGDPTNPAPVSWGWFQGGFRPTSMSADGVAACDSTHTNIGGVSVDDYEAHHDPFQYYEDTSNPHHLPPTSVAMIGKDDQANHQYDLSDFWAAVDAGNMPAVSFLKAANYQDAHPGPNNSDPLDEQHFLVNTINRLESRPEWSSTAVVIAYDDSDGWYDHVFPPNPYHSGTTLDALYPAGQCIGTATTADTFPGRCGFGPRLPLLVISPFARQNFIDHTLTDQTSIIRFIEDNWNLGRIGGGSFDANDACKDLPDTGCGTLANMFDFNSSPAPKLFLQPETGLVNNPPVIDSAQISPTHPKTNDVLSLDVSAHDADAGDNITLSYQWQKNSGTGWTDLTGETGSTLDLATPGNGDRGDLIRAQVTPNDGIQPGTTVTTDAITVADTAPQVQIQPSSTDAQYSDQIGPISVTSSDADGDPVSLTASGLPNGVSLTDHGDGTATISGAVTAPASTYTFSVVGSDGTDSTTETAAIDVAKEDATVVYTGGLFFSTGSTTASTATVTVSARVTQADDGDPGDLTNARVLFDLYKSNNYGTTPDLTVPATVSADGVATATIAALGTDNWTVVARIDPNNGYFTGPSSEPVVMTVYQPSPDKFVTAGGWVHDPSTQNLPVAIGSNDHGNFGFTVRYGKTLTPNGHAVYIFRGSDGFAYIIKSNSWQGGGLAVGPTSGGFGGKANVSVIDPETGLAVAGLGGGNFSYRVDVVDGASTGTSDTYAITVYTPTGALYHQAGTPQRQLPLGGGNVVVHS